MGLEYFILLILYRIKRQILETVGNMVTTDLLMKSILCHILAMRLTFNVSFDYFNDNNLYTQCLVCYHWIESCKIMNGCVFSGS